MLSFESPDQGKILILHGSGADLESAVIPNSQDMAVSMTQAENMVNGTDFEIQDYKTEQKNGASISIPIQLSIRIQPRVTVTYMPSINIL